MPTNSKKTTAPDLSAVLEGLIKADVKFILVGGLAAVVQGAPFTTMDVDIVHSRSSENIVKLLGFLKSIDAFHRRPDDRIIQPTVTTFGRNTKTIEGKAWLLLGPRKCRRQRRYVVASPNKRLKKDWQIRCALGDGH